jgi:hypothetical protein
MAAVHYEEGDSNLELKETLRPTLQAFADDEGIDIYVSNSHGLIGKEESTLKIDPSALWVNFWSIPVGVERYAKAGQLLSAFGIPLPGCVGDSFLLEPGIDYEEQGFVVIRDEVGQILAFGEESVLHIVFDMPHAAGVEYKREAPNILHKILERFFSSPQRIDIKPTDTKTPREAYIQACAWRLEKERADAERKILLCGDKKTNHIKEFARLTHEQEKLRALIEGLNMTEKGERYGAEFDQLIATPHVKRVEVSQAGTVSIFTDTVFLTFDGKLYEIGDFRIDLGLGPRLERGLRIVNLRIKELTGQSRYHHPHVFGEGDKVCFGNIEFAIVKLLGEFEYALAGQAIVKFLCTFNARDLQYTSVLEHYWKPVRKRSKQP